MLRLGAATVALWGCSSGGYSADGPLADPRDLGAPADLRGRVDPGMDLRRAASDKLAFGTPQSYVVRGMPAYLAVLDMNRDGKLDLVSAGLGLDTLLGKGDGSFHDTLAAPAGSGPNGFAAGDLSGDRNPDAVLSRREGIEQIWVLLNRTATP